MRLRKALVCASCAPSQAAQQLYFCAGAAAGVAEGLTAEARHGYCCALERLECRAARAEGRLRGACAESVGRLYYAAGALAGEGPVLCLGKRACCCGGSDERRAQQ